MLRETTTSHTFETILKVAPNPAFKALYTTYFQSRLAKVAVHPVINFVFATAISRMDKETLGAAVHELNEGEVGKSLIGKLFS